MVDRILRFLRSRQMAYKRTFNVESVDARIVLEDLANFCRATESTAHPDTHMRAQLDGRREVYLRIQNHLQLAEDLLYAIATGQETKRTADGDGG